MDPFCPYPSISTFFALNHLMCSKWTPSIVWVFNNLKGKKKKKTGRGEIDREWREGIYLLQYQGL